MKEMIVQLLGSIPGNLGTAALTALACYGAGRALLRRLLPDLRGRETLLALVFGGELFALLGLIGAPLLLKLPAWGVALPLALAAAWGVRELVRGGDPLPGLKAQWEIILALLLLGGWFLASALTLPYSWDEQTYQIAVPAAWLKTGSVMPTADLPYSAFPMMPQFLLVWMFKSGGIGTARLLILGAFLLLYYGLYSELRAAAGRAAACVFTLVFVLSPLTGAMIREFYAEVFLALPMLAVLRLARRYDRPDARICIAFGLLAGGALAVKLTGMGVALAAAGLLCLHRVERRKFAVFALVCGLFAFVFYLRPWIALGNPVYPFFGALFGSGSATVEAYHRAMGETNYGPGGLSGAVLGWLFTAYDGVLYDGIVLGWAFPLLFAAVLTGGYAAFRMGKLSCACRDACLTAGILYVFWAVTSQQSRFLLPLFPVLLIAAGGLWAQLPRRAAWGAAALVFALAAWSIEPWAWKHGYYAWKFLPDSRHDPVRLLVGATRERGLLTAYSYLAEKAPPDTGVLLVFERRSLYCPRQCRLGSPGFQDWFDHARYADWTGELKRRGIRYLLVGASRKNPDVQDAFSAGDEAFSEAIYQALRTGRILLIREASREAFLLFRIP